MTVLHVHLRRRPNEVVYPAATRVLLALLRLYGQSNRVSLTELAHEAGLANRSSVQGHLCTLRDAGLVEWKDRCPGTLRPVVKVVAHGG